MAELRLKNVTKRWGSTIGVDNFDLTIADQEFLVLLGPSGCGKSTTLRCIAGVDVPDAGEIRVDGAVVCDTAVRVPPERRSIGLMFQDFALFPHLSVADNVAFGLTLPRAEARPRAVVR